MPTFTRYSNNYINPGYELTRVEIYLPVAIAISIQADCRGSDLVGCIGQPQYTEIDDPYEAIPVRRSQLGR
ncbi:MAG: hypothetical protein QNJ72_20765 [Pleurocapsa sp. MO_226.B13]|nr:hypothetical protein [Pleurocapsa sp. MO_226.B13]